LRRDFDASRVAFDQHAEMRYQGQRSAIRVALREGDDAEEVSRRFLAAYRGRYGHADEAGPVEFVGLRVAGAAVTERPDIARLHRAGTGGSAEPRSHREIHFGRRLRAAVYVRNSLPIGFRLEGPAVIEEFGATTVIGPGDRLEVGRLGELRIEVAT